MMCDHEFNILYWFCLGLPDTIPLCSVDQAIHLWTRTGDQGISLTMTVGEFRKMVKGLNEANALDDEHVKVNIVMIPALSKDK